MKFNSLVNQIILIRIQKENKIQASYCPSDNRDRKVPLDPTSANWTHKHKESLVKLTTGNDCTWQ